MYNPSQMSVKLFTLAVASSFFLLTPPSMQEKSTIPSALPAATYTPSANHLNKRATANSNSSETLVVQNPSFACDGEEINVSCVLTVPNDGDKFISTEITFNINQIMDAFFKCIASYPPDECSSINISRFMYEAPPGDEMTVSGSITVVYNSLTDKGLHIGFMNLIWHKSGSKPFILNHTVVVAAPPSAPSLQSSVSNFNTATCSADIFLSWNTPPSNRNVDRYFLYLDGSPLATTNSTSYIHSTILNINTDYQYSVTAMSCAGNSTNSSSNVNSVKSYSLMNSSQCLAYDNVAGELTINWELSTPTQPSGVSGLDISYSLQLLYSHSRQGVTYTYTDSTSFTLPSSQLSYTTVLTAHNFTQLDGVETNITANLTIVQQCGQSFNGATMECFHNSNTPTPTIPTTIIKIIIGLVVPFIIVLLLAIVIFLVWKKNRRSTVPPHSPNHAELTKETSPNHAEGAVYDGKTGLT